MPKLNFTKNALEALPAIPGKQYWVTDTKKGELSLCVNSTGKKTFYYYQKVNKVVRRKKLGTLDPMTVEQARTIAHDLAAQYHKGRTPLEELKAAQQQLTFSELFELYYTQHCLRHIKRPEFTQLLYNRHLKPVFGSQKLSDITRQEVRKLHASLTTNSGPSSANRVIEIVRPMFNFAISEGYLDGANPATLIKKNFRPSRERFLDSDEVSKFFEAVKEEPNRDFSDLFTLLLLTGARKGNVLSMRWADVNLETRMWTLSGAQTKNGFTNVIVIPQEGISILNQRKLESDHQSVFVFPGAGRAGHLADPKKAWARLKKRMGVEDIRIHDLRRTLASHMAMDGVPLAIIGKVLNHRSISATTIYARLSEQSVKSAVDTTASKLVYNK